jgi:FMN phosphatase YigB (HAD superfamily)
VNPLKCAFVGDSVHIDVEAARRAGMVPILLSQDEYEDEKLHVIKDMIELLELFK